MGSSDETGQPVKVWLAKIHIFTCTLQISLATLSWDPLDSVHKGTSNKVAAITPNAPED
jgi:hypothetical protein